MQRRTSATVSVTQNAKSAAASGGVSTTFHSASSERTTELVQKIQMLVQSTRFQGGSKSQDMPTSPHSSHSGPGPEETPQDGPGASIIVPEPPLSGSQPVVYVDRFGRPRLLEAPSCSSDAIPSYETVDSTPIPVRPEQRGNVSGGVQDNYRTAATIKEVCRNYLNSRCCYGSQCHRIHPRDRSNRALDPAPQPTLDSKEVSSTSVIILGAPSSSVTPLVKLPPNDLHRNLGFSQKGKSPESAASQAQSLNEALQVLSCLPRSESSSDVDSSLEDSQGKLAGPSKIAVKLCPLEVVDDRDSDSSPDPWTYAPNPHDWDISSGDTSSSSDAEAPSRRRRTSLNHNAARPIMTERARHPPPPNNSICWESLRGRCTRAYNCRYYHQDLVYDETEPSLKSSSSSLVQQEDRSKDIRVKHPRPPNTDRCRQWLYGRCMLGFRCKYVHDDLDYDPPEQPLPPKFPASSWSLPIHDHMKVKIGAGFDVQEITTGFETPWIYIQPLPSHVTSDDITRLLNPFGRVMDVKIPLHLRTPTSSLIVKARFSNHSEAREACTALNECKHFGTTISVRPPVSNKGGGSAIFSDTSVRISWEAPGIVAYGGYPSLERARAAITQAAGPPLRGSFVLARLHEGLPAVGRVTVKFRNLPLDVEIKDMEKFARPEDVMWEKPNYESAFRAESGVKKLLEYGETLPTEFDILPPPYRDGRVVAWAHFSNSSAAQKATNLLHGRKPGCTGKTKIFAHHVHSLTYNIFHESFAKIHSDVLAFREDVHTHNGFGTSVSITHRGPPGISPSPPVRVKLSAENPKILGQLKAEFEKIRHGEILRQPDKVAWDVFFLQATGTAFIRELERQNPGIIIQKDTTRRMLTLFGPPEKRQRVRRTLLSKIAELQAREVRSIPLPGRLIGFFLTADFTRLRKELGQDNVTLDLWNQRLTVRGSITDFEAALAIVQQTKKEHLPRHHTNIIECPVCFDQVTLRITLRCGHAYCRSCLVGYLNAAAENKFFPLTCLGDEAKCPERISLSIAREALSAGEFDSVVDAAFSSHVHSHPKEFHYCPSPDCLQIYRTAPQGTVLQCPSCLLRICPDCHVEYHEGFSCPDRDGGDTLFKEWANSHDVKNCPGCKVPIERAEGCNHVTCIRCQTHICWVCMATFPRGDGIYGHMRAQHGDWGLGPIA